MESVVSSEPFAFADDFCILLWTPAREQLLGKVAMATDSAASTATMRGLLLNFCTSGELGAWSWQKMRSRRSVRTA